jgi:hypothetical protein
LIDRIAGICNTGCGNVNPNGFSPRYSERGGVLLQERYSQQGGKILLRQAFSAMSRDVTSREIRSPH